MIVDMDLSGGEWHCTAYLCRDPNMLAVSKSGKSPHILTAMRMFGVSEEIAKLDFKLTDELTSPEEIASVRKNKIPELEGVRFLPRTASMRNAAKRCLVEGTEVLTSSGWKPIQNISKGDFVFQWHSDFTVSVGEVSKTWKYEGPNKLVSLEGLFYSQQTTRQHKLPQLLTKRRLLEETASEDFVPEGTKYSLPVSGVYKHVGESILSENETRLLVAIQADATIDAYGNPRFKLHKARKQERLKNLLHALSISYTDRKDSVTTYIPRCPSVDKLVTLLTGFSYTRQDRHFERIPRDTAAQKKLFGCYLLDLGTKERQAFIEELSYWDGHISKNRRQYFTTVKQNAEWVQTLSHLNGGRSCIRSKPNGTRKNGEPRSILHWVSLSVMDNVTACSITKCSSEINLPVYCLTVPSGFFMVRHNNKISITGNSNFGLNYREGYKTFALKNEMEERDAKQIVHLYRDVAYPGLKDWYKRTDEQVRKTRVLTNCFNRRVYFMHQMDDDTFRAATAFVPQSTIVDITNRAMPMVLEDDSVEFQPCHLLAQVHDALYIDYASRDLTGMAACVNKIAMDYLSPWLDYGEPFKLKVTAKAGLDWGHLHEIDSSALESGGEPLAEELKRINGIARAVNGAR